MPALQQSDRYTTTLKTTAWEADLVQLAFYLFFIFLFLFFEVPSCSEHGIN